MGRSRREIATIAWVASVFAGCGGQVPLTAPEGAELSITANPTAIPVFEGVSTITVVGFKAIADGGGPLTDGTQIFLTTDVGVIEERVEIQNGVARGNLRSNGRAGLATVTARSGAGIFKELVDGVLIGNATGINILLTANPPTISFPNSTTELVATVFDNDNNRLSDVPIIFTTTAGALASMSTTLRTNALGQATDRLTLSSAVEATVTAFSGAVQSNPVTVNYGAPVTTTIPTTTTTTTTTVPNTPPTCSFVVAPVTGGTGISSDPFLLTSLVAGFDASGSSDPDGTIASYAWNFGDSTPTGSGVSTGHTYAASFAGAVLPVSLTVIDNAGASCSLVQWVQVP